PRAPCTRRRSKSRAAGSGRGGKGLPGESRAVNLNEPIEAAVGRLRDVAADRHVRVTGATEQLAWADADRIFQVLGNLTSNAVKYGSAGTDIAIDVVPHEDAIEVIVTNHGAGIPHDQLTSVFEKFGRTRQARTSRTPGLRL